MYVCMYMYLQHDTCANLSAIKPAPRYSSFGIPVRVSERYTSHTFFSSTGYFGKFKAGK